MNGLHYLLVQLTFVIGTLLYGVQGIPNTLVSLYASPNGSNNSTSCGSVSKPCSLGVALTLVTKESYILFMK